MAMNTGLLRLTKIYYVLARFDNMTKLQVEKRTLVKNLSVSMIG